MSRKIHPAVAGAQPYMLAEHDGVDGPLFDSEEGKDRLQKILSRYPIKNAALLPLLNFAQEKRGWVAPEDMEEIAGALEITPAYVRSVATFYTMYNKHPVGKHHIQVCTCISCFINDAEGVYERFLQETGTRPGEISEDGRFTVTEVECLGACGFATVVQINDEYFEDVTPDSVPGILEELS